ncbi:MAG: T9SS type B sorting domain-containing protein [Bacteroidia bacterium]
MLKKGYFFIFVIALFFTKVQAQCPVTITPTATSVCAGDTTSLTAAGSSTYTWSANAGSVVGATVVVLPVSNTVYTVTADNGTGCISTQTVAIVVNSLPALTVTASPASVCPGGSSTLTASGATSFTWDANAGGVTTASATVTPAVYTTYTVTGSNGTCSTTAVVDVAISATPTISVIANPVNVCASGTSTLSASGASSYTWSSGGTFPTTTVNPSATTVYTVTGINSAGCTGTQTVSVGVTPFLSIFISANPSGVCSGGTTTLTASGASSYTWDANAGGVYTATTSVIPSAPTVYTVTGSSGACVATQTVYVPVVSSFSASAVASPSVICAGQTTTLTASGGSSYSWSSNSGGGGGPTKIVTPSVSTVYLVTATNGTCTATQTVAVMVNPSPTITIDATPASVCAGGTSVLTATSTTATSFTWSANAGGGGVTTAATAVSPPATTVYTVTGSDGTCTSTQTITVNVIPFLIIPVTANPSSVCSSGTTTLTASGADTYTWDINAGGVNTPTTVVTPTVNTTYTVTGSNGACVASQTVNVTVTPTMTISVTPVAPSVCYGQSTTLTVNGASSYTWDANAGNATTQSVVVSPLSNTIYTVMASSGACVATETVLVTVKTNTLTITPPVGTTTLFCTGTPYQFGAVDTTSSGTTAQYYQWSVSPTPVPGVVMTNTACTICNGPTMTFSATGTYTLQVIVNLSSGCIDTAVYALSVVQTPTVIVTNPLPITICQGGTGDTLHVVGALTYTWSPMINVATQYAAGDSVLINPPNAGVYTYTVVGTSSAGCVSEPTVITATVNPPPVVTAYSGITPWATLIDSICSLGSSTVHMDLSYPVAAASYTWTNAASGNLGTPFASSSAVTPNYTGNVDTTYTYYGNLTIPGCPAFPTYTVNLVVVPTPTAYVVSDTVENCNRLGDSLKVTSNPATGVVYNWSPSAYLSSTTGSAVFANPVSAQNITQTYYVTPVIIVGNNVCPGKPDSVKVLIGDTTNAQIDPRYWIDCAGMIDTLIAFPTRTPLNNTYQYYWTLPAIASGTTSATGDSIFVTPSAIGTYTLNVRGTCVKKKTAEILIAVNNCMTPIPSFSVTADTICRRKCITYTDMTLQNSSTQKPLFYMWTFTVQPPQSSIFCIGQGCTIHSDTVWFEATDSSALPKIKVCYYINSSLNTNGVFPVTEYVSHGPYTLVPAATATMGIAVYNGPLANAGQSQTITLGDAATLDGTHSAGTLGTVASYSWSPSSSVSCATCPQTAATPSVNTQYVLTVIDNNGCTDTSNVMVFVNDACFDPFVPTGFSPNGDGLNDSLFVRSNCLTNFTFKVFDRWGEKVFETDNLDKGWDGRFRGDPMNAAVFVYTLEGYLKNGKSVKQKGNITLVR